MSHRGHVKNNEAPQKSTYQGNLFGSGVFCTGFGIFSGCVARRPSKRYHTGLTYFNIYRFIARNVSQV